MKKNEKFVITINREVGSGGRTVGQKLAEKYLGKNGKLLESPNNILAVEYLKAIKISALKQ